MLLDDTSAIADDPKKRREFVKMTIFSLAKNRQRIRSGHYDRVIDAVQSDHRSIVLASGEDILFDSHSLRGEDVRLIHIPADYSDLGDIFDAENASEIVGTTVAKRDQYVDALEKATFKHQGKALRAFIRRLVTDEKADQTAPRYIKEFIEESPLPEDVSAFHRIRRRFAVVYAGLALAIDYGVVPLRKRASLRDLRKCMNDAFDLLREKAGSSNGQRLAFRNTDSELLDAFRKRIASATFVEIGIRKTISAGLAGGADGFVKWTGPKKFRVVLNAERLREWYPENQIRNSLVKLLRTQQVLRAGRQADAATCLETIISGQQRMSCYRLSMKSLGLKKAGLQISGSERDSAESDFDGLDKL